MDTTISSKIVENFLFFLSCGSKCHIKLGFHFILLWFTFEIFLFLKLNCLDSPYQVFFLSFKNFVGSFPLDSLRPVLKRLLIFTKTLNLWRKIKMESASNTVYVELLVGIEAVHHFLPIIDFGVAVHSNEGHLVLHHAGDQVSAPGSDALLRFRQKKPGRAGGHLRNRNRCFHARQSCHHPMRHSGRRDCHRHRRRRHGQTRQKRHSWK